MSQSFLTERGECFWLWHLLYFKMLSCKLLNQQIERGIIGFSKNIEKVFAGTALLRGRFPEINFEKVGLLN